MNASLGPNNRVFLTAFNQIVRLSSLAECVQLQRVGLAVDQLLSQLAPDAPLPLAPLHQMLREWNAPDEAIAEAFLALKSREDLLGRAVVLPPGVEGLSEAKKSQLLQAFARRAARQGGDVSGPVRAATGASRAPAPSAPAEQRAHEGQPRAKDEPRTKRPKGKSGPGLAGAIPRTNTALLALCVLLILGAVGMSLYTSQTAPQTFEAIQIDINNGIGCVSIRKNGSTAECVVSKMLYETMAESRVQERAAATKKALAPRGVERLIVRTDDGVLRGSF